MFHLRVRRKAEALVAAGYSVDVLALRSKFSKGETYELNGVTVHTFELGKQRGSGLRYVYEYATFLLWCTFRIGKLMKQKRFQLHFTPTYSSWLNLVERWFAELTTKWIANESTTQVTRPRT